MTGPSGVSPCRKHCLGLWENKLSKSIKMLFLKWAAFFILRKHLQFMLNLSILQLLKVVETFRQTIA